MDEMQNKSYLTRKMALNGYYIKNELIDTDICTGCYKENFFT